MMIDRTEKIDKRLKELKGMTKQRLLQIYNLTRCVNCADMKIPKSDLINDIIDMELGWKNYHKKNA